MWSRGASLSICCALFACKMANPAFEAGEESRGDADDDTSSTQADATGAEGSTTTDSTTQSTTGPSTTDTTDSQTTSGDGDTDAGDGDAGDGDAGDGDAGDGDTGDGDGDACDLPGAAPLRFRYHHEGLLPDCPDMVDLDVLVVGTGMMGGVEVYPCTEACGQCMFNPFELAVDAINISDVATMTQDECAHVTMQIPTGETGTYCEYGRMLFRHYEDVEAATPLLVGSSVDGDDPSFASTILSGAGLLPWSFFVGFECDCPMNDSDPCCLSSDPPAAYDLEAGKGGQVKPGESLPFSVIMIPYSLHLWSAKVKNSCGAILESSWLIRPQ